MSGRVARRVSEAPAVRSIEYLGRRVCEYLASGEYDATTIHVLQALQRALQRALTETTPARIDEVIDALLRADHAMQSEIAGRIAAAGVAVGAHVALKVAADHEAGEQSRQRARAGATPAKYIDAMVDEVIRVAGFQPGERPQLPEIDAAVMELHKRIDRTGVNDRYKGSYKWRRAHGRRAVKAETLLRHVRRRLSSGKATNVGGDPSPVT